MKALNAKDILQGNGFFVTLTHGVGRLFFEAINGPNACHEPVTDIHQHAGGEQKGTDTQKSHDTDQVDDNGVEGTDFVVA